MLLLFGLQARAQRDTLYLWQSQEGTVIEKGGVIAQHNGGVVKRINQECSGFYVVTLCGKSSKIESNVNNTASCYMTITLADDKTFTAGDTLTISGMRNINKDYKASIFFRYSNGATVLDTCTWNNLGQYKEMTFGGGTSSTSAKSAGSSATPQSVSTEPFTTYSMDPSTYRFCIPAEANGSTSLTLTLNDSETYLYLSSIVLTHYEEVATSIEEAKSERTKAIKHIVKGHIQIERDGKKYHVNGLRIN